MAKISKFYRGSATFKCGVCGRGTRDNGTQGLGMKLCPQCYELAGIENEISDGHTTLEERTEEIKRLVADVAAKGGNVTDWNTTFELEVR